MSVTSAQAYLLWKGADCKTKIINVLFTGHSDSSNGVMIACKACEIFKGHWVLNRCFLLT